MCHRIHIVSVARTRLTVDDRKRADHRLPRTHPATTAYL
ncbi:hypothetical protein BN903_165 [Halorubrum sp. AJ67]|nr:hypothetical protein BN903_165 [Halorubrum sp. AJ67]